MRLYLRFVKLGVMFQIIEKTGGPIKWNELDLPEGRTVKAVQVMIEKEKAKVRRAKADENGASTPVTPKKAKDKVRFSSCLMHASQIADIFARSARAMRRRASLIQSLCRRRRQRAFA